MTTVSLIDLLETLDGREAVLVKTAKTAKQRAIAAAPEMNPEDCYTFIDVTMTALMGAWHNGTYGEDYQLLIVHAIITGMEAGRELERRAK